MLPRDETSQHDIPHEPAEEPVWSYRGYRLKASEFVTAIVHLFRAEIQRANVWRQRLDTTTNWAVVATGATLSVSFSQPSVHHGVIILNTLLITWFLFIEARRYRYYELWSYRIRLIETDFYAPMLVPPFQPSPEWAESLAENLLSPSFPISMWEAFGRRLRKNYLWIYFMLAISWVGKSYLFPQPTTSWSEFALRAAVGPIPGGVMIALGILYNGVLILLALGTLGMNKATGEILPRFGEESIGMDIHTESLRPRASESWLHPHRRRKQYLAYIVTDKPEEVSQCIMNDLKRGVTALQGLGMYTGKGRTVLMCALTVTEVNNLKSAAAKHDPNAFMILSPAQEILGRGFAPLQEQ